MRFYRANLHNTQFGLEDDLYSSSLVSVFLKELIYKDINILMVNNNK